MDDKPKLINLGNGTVVAASEIVKAQNIGYCVHVTLRGHPVHYDIWDESGDLWRAIVGSAEPDWEMIRDE